MSERDPRVDPKPGDVLRGSGLAGRNRTVMAVDRFGVWYGPYFNLFSMEDWRKWAAKATVVRKASDD